MAVSPPATSVPSSGMGSTSMNSVIGCQKLSISSRASSRSSSYSSVQVAQTLNSPGNASLSSEAQSSSHSGSSSRCPVGAASAGRAPTSNTPAQTAEKMTERSGPIIAVSSRAACH